MKKLLLLLSTVLLVSCGKQKDCVVKKVTTIKESRIDSTTVKREYLVTLECY